MNRPRTRSFRQALQFYLIDCNSKPGRLIDIFIILLNLLICTILVVETYSLEDATRTLLWRVEVVIVLFFCLEYAARLYGAENRRRQLFDIYAIIDLIAILPTLLLLVLPLFGLAPDVDSINILRVFRVFRIFRFYRFTADSQFFFGSITMTLLKVVRLALAILTIFFVASAFFYMVENRINPTVATFGDAFYFTVVTLTTVGFGDITPQSEAGRWVTVLMILSGITVIPWEVSQIVKEWARMGTKKEVLCPGCGLRYHDQDASHCKSCGHIIFQEYDGG